MRSRITSPKSVFWHWNKRASSKDFNEIYQLKFHVLDDMNWNENLLIKQATRDISETFFIIIKGKFKGRWNFHRFSFFIVCSSNLFFLCHWEVFLSENKKFFFYSFLTPFRLYPVAIRSNFLHGTHFHIIQISSIYSEKKFRLEGFQEPFDREAKFLLDFLLCHFHSR